MPQILLKAMQARVAAVKEPGATYGRLTVIERDGSAEADSVEVQMLLWRGYYGFK